MKTSLLVLVLASHLLRVVEGGLSYEAAVVQGYFPNKTDALANVERFFKEASARNVEIIVFAEGALGSNTATDMRPFCEHVPEAPAALCGDSEYREADAATPLSTAMSCLARRYRIVTVFAMCDIQPCNDEHDNCTKWAVDGKYHFNTGVAVDRDGMLVAKYHKMHLYDTAPGVGESTHASYPPTADPVYFDTHFGVRFGMHTCFDMAFRTPGAAMALDPKLGIKDFVFPTGWVVGEPPMLPPNEVQQGWSRGVGVNLLAADGGHTWGSAGSGIYSQGVAIAKVYKPFELPNVEMLIATVPKLSKSTPNLQASADLWGYKTEPARASLNHATDMLHKLPQGSGGEAVVPFFPQKEGRVNATTSGGFKCTFTYTTQLSAPSREKFALLALEGAWLQGVVPSRSCLVYRCTTAACSAHPLYSSPADFNATLIFQRMELEGTFAAGDLVLPMVAVADGDIVDNIEMSYAGGYMALEHFEKPLLNLMLYANVPESSTIGAHDILDSNLPNSMVV